MIIITGSKKNLAHRYFSNVIDYSIFIIFTAIVTIVLGQENGEGEYNLDGLKALILPLAWFIYFPVSESILGWTMGKKTFDLKVVDLKGKAPSITQSTARRMLDLVELTFLGIPAVVAINHSPKNQRLGDMLAGTTVIKTIASCRYCNTAIELPATGVVEETFVCPNCEQSN